MQSQRRFRLRKNGSLILSILIRNIFINKLRLGEFDTILKERNVLISSRIRYSIKLKGFFFWSYEYFTFSKFTHIYQISGTHRSTSYFFIKNGSSTWAPDGGEIDHWFSNRSTISPPVGMKFRAGNKEFLVVRSFNMWRKNDQTLASYKGFENFKCLVIGPKRPALPTMPATILTVLIETKKVKIS